MLVENAEEEVSAPRRLRMELLAKADESLLADAWNALPEKPQVARVRGPETGLVMLRGRIGGAGSPFNFGEATVTRCTVRLATGEIGHGHTLGISHVKAELAASFDAMAECPDATASVDELLTRIAAELNERNERRARQTAATKVDFFTMVRGED